jgi:hypothetical protein
MSVLSAIGACYLTVSTVKLVQMIFRAAMVRTMSDQFVSSHKSVVAHFWTTEEIAGQCAG